jgi:hypothetical protein
MPRYYFHTDDLRDPEGSELESLVVAKCEAVKLAGRIICDASDTFWNNAEWSMTVTDEKGLTLFQLQIVGTDAPSILVAQPSPASA